MEREEEGWSKESSSLDQCDPNFKPRSQSKYFKWPLCKPTCYILAGEDLHMKEQYYHGLKWIVDQDF